MARDIQQGIPGNEWFLSAVSILAECPQLIKRLFVTTECNHEGVYRLRLCKNGRWREVTIDELIPCYPKGEPVFATCVNGDLWVPLLEKAYAKVHGGYHQLKGGSVHEALMDLTGCPTNTYELEDENVRDFIKNGSFWNLIGYFKK